MVIFFGVSDGKSHLYSIELLSAASLGRLVHTASHTLTISSWNVAGMRLANDPTFYEVIVFPPQHQHPPSGVILIGFFFFFIQWLSQKKPKNAVINSAGRRVGKCRELNIRRSDWNTACRGFFLVSLGEKRRSHHQQSTSALKVIWWIQCEARMECKHQTIY